jgi:S-adenosylmethionine-diacylgycerolhomoserine-N-methlytransferase
MPVFISQIFSATRLERQNLLTYRTLNSIEKTMTSTVAQLKTLYTLALSPIRGDTHEERLESFYCSQADDYDGFRKRMLHGRAELFSALTPPAGGTWVDLGSGTGENPEHLGESLSQLANVKLVDLSKSLLSVAQRRIAERQWNNVSTVHADATQYDPGQAVDLVTFSYSLTMIPNWFAAIENAWRMLKPGGTIGIVDFYIARKFPAAGRKRHGWTTRTLWPAWFAMDNVYLSPDHLPLLESRFETIHLNEQRGKIPFLPFVRAPYYRFIGRKAE